MAAKKKAVKKPVTKTSTKKSGSRKDVLYYAEFLQHYLGDNYSTAEVKRADLIAAAARYDAEQLGGLDEDEDAADTWLEKRMHGDGTLYFAGDMFGPYDAPPCTALKNVRRILKAIDSKGVYGKTVEEGSFAIGKTMSKATRTVDKLETKVKHDCGGSW